MRKTKVIFYTNNKGVSPVKNDLFKLTKRQQGKVQRAIQPIVEFGVGTHIRNIKKLTGTPLWEIRILGRDNIRILYAMVIAGSIVLLNIFVKKSQKTPRKELKIALERLADAKRRLTSWYHIWYHVIMYKGFVTFEEVLEDQLRDPEFRKEWEDSEADYQVSRQMIKARLEKKMSQRALAKKVKTSQARISQLENMNGNPSLSFLRRVSSALDIKFQLSV